jgi:hypothetical protein
VLEVSVLRRVLEAAGIEFTSVVRTEAEVGGVEIRIIIEPEEPGDSRALFPPVGR